MLTGSPNGEAQCAQDPHVRPRHPEDNSQHLGSAHSRRPIGAGLVWAAVGSPWSWGYVSAGYGNCCPRTQNYWFLQDAIQFPFGFFLSFLTYQPAGVCKRSFLHHHFEHPLIQTFTSGSRFGKVDVGGDVSGFHCNHRLKMLILRNSRRNCVFTGELVSDLCNGAQARCRFSVSNVGLDRADHQRNFATRKENFLNCLQLFRVPHFGAWNCNKRGLWKEIHIFKWRLMLIRCLTNRPK